MKEQILFLGVILGCIIFSCSNNNDTIDESNNNDQNGTIKLYKKSISYGNDTINYTKEINYNSNNRIQSITSHELTFNLRTFQFVYSNNEVISIIENVHYLFNDTEFSQTYSVINEPSKITLTTSGDDRTIEINHSEGYVDSTKVVVTSTSMTVFNNIFLRDDNKNIISITDGNIVFTYSNFDYNKKNDPLGACMTYEFADFFMAFNLKVSNDNPRTSTYNQSGNTGTENIYLEYDGENYVIRKSYDPNSTSTYVEHQYILL